MKQLLTRALHDHNRAAHLVHENERLREALTVIAVIATSGRNDSMPHVARLARNALLGYAPPDAGEGIIETKED
jgi:hypothetical protein